MIALDTNFLVAAIVREAEGHARAARWLEGRAERLSTTAINLSETLRLVTHPRVFPKPSTLSRATVALRAFLSELEISQLDEPSDWIPQLASLLEGSPRLADLRGNDIFDARIALILRHNGVERICSSDSDFDKFEFIERVLF